MKTIREYFQFLSEPRKGLHWVTIDILDLSEKAAKRGDNYMLKKFSVHFKEQVIEELITICKLDVEIVSESDWLVQIEVSW